MPSRTRWDIARPMPTLSSPQMLLFGTQDLGAASACLALAFIQIG